MRWILLGIVVAATLYMNVAVRPWMLDDSFITFRYAENLGAGNGPVYNPGIRVEGYTCFLWVVLLSPARWIGVATPALSQWFAGLFAASTILLLFSGHRFLKTMDAGTSAWAALFLGTSGIFAPWISSGMEVMLFTFLLLLSVMYSLRIREDGSKKDQALLGLLLAILVMARPDGIVPAFFILCDQVIYGIRSNRGAWWLAATAFAVVFVPYFFWRYSYYGYLLPNTFYAKVGSGLAQFFRGARYSFRFIIATLPLLPAIFFKKTSKPPLLLAAILVWIWVGYVTFVGGDIMPAFRFYTPILPLLCILTAVSLQQSHYSGQTKTLIAASIALFNLMQFQFNPQVLPYVKSDTVAEDGKEVGLWLKQNAPPGAVLATNTAGSVPYYSGLRTIDMLGLNDIHIAHRQISNIGFGPAGHEKGDGAYVLSLDPDFIQFGSSLGSNRPLFLSDREMSRIPAFSDKYELRTHLLSSGKRMMLYERKRR